MAADKTAITAAHADLTADVAYTINLTGAGNTLELISHGHSTNTDVYYVIAGSEGSLPTLTAGMDDSFVLHSTERVINGAPLSDCWVRVIADGANVSISAQLRTQK